MTPGLLSVVVIGRNEGERLARCLASVATMEHAGFALETIYVDSASVDASVALAEATGARAICLNQARTTAALGRNAGWRASAGDLILFLDGDTVLDPQFVVRALPAFNDEAIAVVWGHRREQHPEASLYNRVLDLDWIYAPGLTAFCGGDALFRRSVLEAAGGFDETLIAGEEPELCRRISGLGFGILHVDLAMTGHDLGMTRFSEYWRRATRAGHAFAEVSERFRTSAQPFWLADAQRNRRRAVTLLGLVAAGLVGSACLRNVWPAGVVLVVLVALALRSAWKARWKTNDVVGLLLYGAHSHFQQVPIFVGQMQFRRNRRRGVRRGLVEYKRS